MLLHHNTSLACYPTQGTKSPIREILPEIVKSEDLEPLDELAIRAAYLLQKAKEHLANKDSRAFSLTGT